MKKNLLIKLFLTAVITHFSLYCSELPEKGDEKARKEAEQKKLSIEARWAKLLEANPYQARPMPVTPAQPDHIFKASSAVQFRSDQDFPSVQPIPAAPQHIHAVQPAKSQELPLEVFFAQEDYQAWQKLEQYLQRLETRFPFNRDKISEIRRLFILAKSDCALKFYLRHLTKDNPNKRLSDAINEFDNFKRAVDQGKEGVRNFIDPIESYLAETHY